MKATLDELYSLAREARDSKDRVGAETYYEAILQKDSNGWEAPFYLAFYKVANSSINSLASNCQDYTNSFAKVFDLAKVSCQDIDSFVAVAKEVREKTEALTNVIISDAYNDYPALATSDELSSRVFSAFTMYLILSEAFDIYFPNGEMAADAADLRKKAIQHYSDLALFMGVNSQVIESGDFERAFGATVAKVRKFDPMYSLPSPLKSTASSSSKASSSGCYVATCVYGSYDCPEVWTLRRFRDYKLERTRYGRLFIKTYYALSPSFVKWFGETSWFKAIWQGVLDKFVKTLNDRGYSNSPYNDK